MQITLAIPTYDRRDILALTSGVLNRMPWLERVNVRIYDDASSLTVGELERFFPTAREIIKRPHNLGADCNTRQLIVDFVNGPDDCLLVLDSDLVVSEKVIPVLAESLPRTDGVLSLYNSMLHAAYGSLDLDGHEFVLKRSVGAAGTAFTRRRAEEIVARVPAGVSFDWRFCDHFAQTGIRLFVTRKSLVQHLGFQGSNCREGLIDFGFSFDCDDPTTRASMCKVLEDELVATIQRLQRFDQELGLNLRDAGKILERSIRKPLKSWWRGVFKRNTAWKATRAIDEPAERRTATLPAGGEVCPGKRQVADQ